MSISVTYYSLIVAFIISLLLVMKKIDNKLLNITRILAFMLAASGFFYQKHMDYMKNNNNPDYKYLNQTRYNDYFVTYPMILLILYLILCHRTKKSINNLTVIGIFLVNMFIVFASYLNKTEKMTKNMSVFWQVILFFVLLGLYYKQFGFNTKDKVVLFTYLYLIIVGKLQILGRIIFKTDEGKSNYLNFIDLLSKSVMGIVLCGLIFYKQLN
jgi:hypothetical protein